MKTKDEIIAIFIDMLNREFGGNGMAQGGEIPCALKEEGLELSEFNITMAEELTDIPEHVEKESSLYGIQFTMRLRQI